MTDRTAEFFQAAAKFGHKPSNYLEIKIGERHHNTFNSSYVLEGTNIYKQIMGETNTMLKHLILNSQQSSIFDGSQKVTLQIKDEITRINLEINDLKTQYQARTSSSRNSEDDDKN